MTKQTKNPGMGLYFLAIILLLLAYYAFAGGDRTPTVTYAQVEDLFQQGQVTSFYVRDGNQLYLNLQDGTTVTQHLGQRGELPGGAGGPDPPAEGRRDSDGIQL